MLLDRKKIVALINNLESEHVERTRSTSDTDKFSQAICAFSNDLFNTKKNGYLIIGVDDSGNLTGLKATDRILQNIGGLRSDGNILPQPIMSIQKATLEKGDVIIVEVQPSPFPPVRYKGKTWIRTGPRKAVANEMEERLLIEKRSSNINWFDSRPCLDANLDDLELDVFKNNYLHKAIDPVSLKKDNRVVKDQLAALRFYSLKYDCPTNAGVIVFGKNPVFFIPGCYIQYVEFSGDNNAGEIINEKKFSSNLISLINRIDVFIDDAIIFDRPKPISSLIEKNTVNFPRWAIRELLMNAIMHRDYESNAPIKFYKYTSRLVISNAGGLFGKARPENFPEENDYRNPVIAEAMKTLGFVNRFNRGISRVQSELIQNGNPLADFVYSNPELFSVSIFESKINEKTTKKTTRKTTKKTTKKTITNTTGKISNYIIEMMIDNRDITAKEISERMGISENGVWYHIKSLKKKGKIVRIGADKGGYWKVIDKNL